jgi:predicted metalloenzyme YecM
MISLFQDLHWLENRLNNLLQPLLIDLEANPSLLGKFSPDHIGWDCGSNIEYTSIIKMLFEHDLISTGNIEWINGREIFVGKFKKPLELFNGTYMVGFNYIEICDQKADNSQISGLNHIELVLHQSYDFPEMELYKTLQKYSEIIPFRRDGYENILYKISVEDIRIIVTQNEFLKKKIAHKFCK